MKRFAVLTIAIVMSVLFAACRNDNNSNVPAKQTSQSTEESTTSTKKSTKESTTKSTSAENTEKTTRESESGTAMDRTNEDSMDGTELAPYETDNMNNDGINGDINETSYDGTGTNFDDLFEEGTVSNGSGEGVIDQIGDDIMR